MWLDSFLFNEAFQFSSGIELRGRERIDTSVQTFLFPPFTPLGG